MQVTISYIYMCSLVHVSKHKAIATDHKAQPYSQFQMPNTAASLMWAPTIQKRHS